MAGVEAIGISKPRTDPDDVDRGLRGKGTMVTVSKLELDQAQLVVMNNNAESRDDAREVQNSGIRIVAETMHFASAKDRNPVLGTMTYYGVIEEIWELNYFAFRIPLFKCSWVDNNVGVKTDELGFTLVDLTTENAAEQEEEGEVAGEAYVPQPYAPQDEVQPQIYAEEFISLNDQGILYNFDDHAALNQQVHLCSDNIDNIVARGYLYEHVGEIKVHCKDYDDSHARIMVSEILQEDAEIPVPLEEFRYVRDVYQMFLPWPKHLILTTEGPLAQPPSRRDASKGKAPMLSPQSRGAREDELFTEEKMALIPNSLKWMIHEFLRLKDKRDIITISVPRGFIAPRTQIILSREDLQQVATCNYIGNQGMLFGMMHIWESINGLRKIFKFYDPELLTVHGISDEERVDLLTMRQDDWLIGYH
ncbi:uncharacterized protein LOC133039607 [Cannabis sativa]|uniref:uncharacterized protein LOC133039607 n=1 Tax=Cannabis sativa TaxID=3483 RepID=UPI0029CA8CF9|nr:uncharacterized protein LOC133039607 [Cannabis sativa]